MSDVKRMDPNYEIATATLVKINNGDYHVHLTIYVDKQKLVNYRKSKIEKEKYVNMSKQYNVKNDVSDEKEELNDDYIMKLSQKFNVITKKQ